MCDHLFADHNPLSSRWPRSLCSTVLMLLCCTCAAADELWTMHTIDQSSRGADGVRLGDVNQDGRLDIATGWEEGGRIRVCLQPKASEIRKPWPSVCVGKVKSPEDAVFADVNGDGLLDVVSSCEGQQQALFYHLNPGQDRIMAASAWETKVMPASFKLSRWMYCEPLADGQLMLGSKAPHGMIAIHNIPRKQITHLRQAGWVMSLRCCDIDHDGHADIVYSDRKGDASGVGWLQNPGNSEDEWLDHPIGGQGLEVMFLDVAHTADHTRIVCNTRNGYLLDMTPTADVSAPWKTRQIAHPPRAGAGKAVAICDVNHDGRPDLVCTCGLAENKHGVFWLEQPAASADKQTPQQSWIFHEVSGTEIGVKFDRIEMLDIDGDGDKDLLTCEERDNLGVIWYENPQS